MHNTKTELVYLLYITFNIPHVLNQIILKLIMIFCISVCSEIAVQLFHALHPHYHLQKTLLKYPEQQIFEFIDIVCT
jgi:hypothetical protein